MKKGIARAVVFGIALIVAGAGVALYPTYTDWTYSLAQWSLGTSAQAQEPAGETGIALPEGAVAKLVVPKIGFEAYVVEGTDQDALAKGPGHYPGTPLPGEDGNCAIAGHRTMYGHPFRDLDQMAEGDQILTHTTVRSSVYQVVDVRIVDPSEVGVAAATDDSRLTLTTCHPVGSARQRLVVVAELVE